ncbi:MAG TPA: pyridoxamine 5'-phosphate oxidase family protein [Pyrinomonadaceae bacterium]|nr:pyridoxamine 5'-phosphate oxidase family protein [Pyrinomonadaceae bacterium]
MEEFRPTGRTTLRRLPQRAEYGREAVYQILDEAFVCHVGFVSGGSPFVIPTAYGRAGDVLYLHGARASRMLKELARGPEVCVTVTLLDGLVLARSAFHHSINYRSVVVLGRAEVVEDPSEKMEALRLFTEHIVRGRWDEVREPSPQEMNATLVLRLPLAEASAKVRTGPPVDDEEDMTWPVWAGELPLRLVASEPVADPHTGDGLSAPSYLLDYNRG